jgi:hypothetical protein
MRQNKKAKGGDMEQMNQLLGDGGMMDDSGEQVNGVEVPVGSLKEEVADDIPAQLSEGEFVVPADVVRFIGLEKLMQLRDKAKEGLLRMEEMGQMGNAQEVENPDQSFMQDDEDFGSEIDDIMAEDTPMPAGFRTGGFITGEDISRVPSNPAVAVGYYKHTDGRMMWITKINGKPMSAPPDGFSEVSAEEFQNVGKKADEAAKVVAKPSTSTGMTGSGGDSSYGDGTTPSGSPSSSSPTIGTGKGLQVGTPMLSPLAQATLATVAPITAAPLAFMNKANAQTNANNAAMTADSFAGVGGLSQAGITAANAAMAAESGRFGFGDNAPTPGSVAAAGASAGSAVNNTNAMDAMMGAIQADKGTPGTASPSAPGTVPAQNNAPVVSNQGTTAESAAGMQPGESTPGNDSFTGPPAPGGNSGNGNSSRYCCSRMVHHGLWDVNHEFARLTVWSRRQPNWWRSGYPVWGKVIAKNLLQEEGFWTDVMQAFYDAKVRKQPRTIKSTIAEIVIYPGAFVCGMIYKDIPTKATLADPSEFI